MTILDAIHDPLLFRPLFKDLATWKSWMTVLKSVFSLPMDEAELSLFKQLTGRETPPVQQVQECWLVCGRRGGKSFVVSLVAVFLACFRDYRPYLGPGERGVLMVIATDRRQARVIHRYCTALLNAVPMLASMIERQDSESIDLNNRVSIEITTASYRTIRGYTVVAALCDEISFWRSEDSANPAEEILAALRPAMSTVPGSMLLCLGTAYRRSGPLYDSYRRHYGQDSSSVLVIQAATRTMNPTVPQSVIDRAMELDPMAASAEYLAQFRSDVGSFLDADLIDRAVTVGVRERPLLRNQTYMAFADPSGGSHDSFTISIGHIEKDRYIIDAIRGVRPPFSPDAVVKEFCDLLKQYRCISVTGDRYSGQWTVEAFSKEGITYRHSERSKSELYLECVPLFAQGCVDLLDVQPLIVELMQLERRTSRSGRDSVDHPPGAGSRDDFANACCGVLSMLAAQQAQGGAYMVNFLTGELIHHESEEERLLRREARLTNVPVESIRARWETLPEQHNKEVLR
jgi:hypothetical protein